MPLRPLVQTLRASSLFVTRGENVFNVNVRLSLNARWISKCQPQAALRQETLPLLPLAARTLLSTFPRSTFSAASGALFLPQFLEL